MEDLPITGLEELERHLQTIQDDPETPLDEKLFDEVELQLTGRFFSTSCLLCCKKVMQANLVFEENRKFSEHPSQGISAPTGLFAVLSHATIIKEHKYVSKNSNILPLIPRLLPSLSQILTTYQKDPTILASLAVKLLKPIPFTQVLTLASEESLIQALLSPAPSANVLAITVIEKASRSPGDTAILSIMQGVVKSFLRTWLSTPHVDVGEKATRALGDLLEVDCDRRSITPRMNGMDLASRIPPGQGLLWRRLFQDHDIYEMIFSLCSSQTIGTGEGELDERQKSLAQARLLRILPRLAALDFHAISHTNFTDVEVRYGLQGGEQGILWFAAVDMVNKEEDMLMHITVIDFFAEFLDVMSTTEITQSMMNYLAALLKKVTEADQTMYKSLESIAMNPESSPELVDLLVRLNQHHE
ncbi:hypothetical protein D0Z07_3153 [Hyphodiscus hymeniophilus]|uniref:DNA mismatch repair protein HSM3 N-terminal domain-containing protein n=1 Tax=Hyphodiscus hymeniophilus TaxID=353542 RepID=A0A9P6VLW4_9HELO|nr:hypothetical protein D0Z07_3153 [Hyphodiscus hymeniophilus]